MAAIHRVLVDKHRLRHFARIQYIVFLKVPGGRRCRPMMMRHRATRALMRDRRSRAAAATAAAVGRCLVGNGRRAV